MIHLKERYRIINFIFIVLAIIFLAKLFYIQVINKHYKFSANNNVLRYDVQQAVRGLIFDRNNNLLVANVPAYDLLIIPRELKGNNIDTLKFCSLINIKKQEFIEKYNKAVKYSTYKEMTPKAEYIDLCCMTHCDNLIIACSSFSWWGAYLNKKEGKIIVSDKWWGPQYADREEKDIRPPQWIQQKAESNFKLVNK